MVTDLIRDAVVLTTVFSAAPLAASIVTATATTVCQTVLQLQEQTLVHIVRIATGGAVLVFGSPWAFREVSLLFDRILSLVVIVSQSPAWSPKRHSFIAR
jgi:flagellar biosynthesis protein FliQ